MVEVEKITLVVSYLIPADMAGMPNKAMLYWYRSTVKSQVSIHLTPVTV